IGCPPRNPRNNSVPIVTDKPGSAWSDGRRQPIDAACVVRFASTETNETKKFFDRALRASELHAG
ncbi:hypothetical protein Q2941_44205, partial [Bradyrhizobium sp. UFLA05-153]